MNNETRQSYDIDNRRAGTYADALGKSWAASDNEGGNQFLRNYLARRRAEATPNLDFEKSQEGRIQMAGPGDAVYGYRNEFRARQ